MYKYPITMDSQTKGNGPLGFLIRLGSVQSIDSKIGPYLYDGLADCFGSVDATDP